MQWFINYKQDVITPAERGLAYGDGLFETIKSSPAGFEYLEGHFARLHRGLKKLDMPLSTEKWQQLRRFLYDTVLPLVNDISVVKIIVTRGEGGRGYLPPKECQHNIFIGVAPAPDYQQARKAGVRLGVSDVPVTVNPFLAGMKHLNRLENVLAKQRMQETNFEEVMLNSQGDVIECIQSNVFWFYENELHTPLLDKSGVQGVYRSQLFEQTLFKLQSARYSLADLQNADEVFITNSLMGIVPVTQLQERSLPIGVHTQRLQQLMQTKDVHDIC